MPLFSITGDTYLKKTYYVCFALLSRERQADYEWALQALKRLYQQIEVPDPATLLTDRDLGIVRVIQTVLPTSKHLLCLWHVETNILAQCKYHFQTDEAWTTFSKAWSRLPQAPTTT